MKAPDLVTETTLTAVMQRNRDVARSLFFIEGERAVTEVPYALLYRRALGILHHLQRLGVQPGDHLILQLGSNEPFIDAFWAAILGGIIPVPVAPGISDEHRHKLLRIAAQLGTPWLYTEQRLLERIDAFGRQNGLEAQVQALRQRSFLIDDLKDITRAGQIRAAAPGDVAFIQFSSGSTSEPKGVVLTHANLISNIRAIGQAAAVTPEDIALSWMPLTHDMGLIGFHLTPFAHQLQTHLMPTELFVRRPLLWLQSASRLRATVLCSPNFGYRHYLKVLHQRAPEGLDLSSVRLILNGAEPISVELCEEFLSCLAPVGLKPASMFPVYGLAEASLAVTFPKPGQHFTATAFDRHKLGMGQTVEPVAAGSGTALRVMSVGRTVADCQVRIADAQDQPLPAEHVGQILIRGANVTAGYFRSDNQDTFAAEGWLRTGDLGVMHGDTLYITGRQKEILFVNGQNYYPHDLERIAENVTGTEMGKIAIAAIRPAGADEEAVAAFVLHRGDMSEFVPLAQAVRRSIAENTGVHVALVVPVNRIPKTTSGKVQRHLLVEQYQAGDFNDAIAAIGAIDPALTLQQHAHNAGGDADTTGAIPETATPAGGSLTDTIRALCEAELEGRTLDLDENLFEIGASSLRLMAIHERIDRQWPGLVEVPDLFDHPTVRDVAALIDSRLKATASPVS